MKLKYRGVAVLLACAGVSVVAIAPAGGANVVFQAYVSDNNNGGGDPDPDPDPDPDLYACIIEVLQAGAFATNVARDALDSEQAGGAAAQVRVISLKPDPSSGTGYTITFEAPASFSNAPSGGNSNVTFSSRMSGASDFNGVNFAMQDGTLPVTLPDAGLSITNLTAHLRGAKSDGPFPSGTYRAEGVVRCE